MQKPDTLEQLRTQELYRGFPFAETIRSDSPPNLTGRVPIPNYGILTFTAKLVPSTGVDKYTIAAVLRAENDSARIEAEKRLRISAVVIDGEEGWFISAPPDPDEATPKAIVWDLIDTEKIDEAGNPQLRILDQADLALLECKVVSSPIIQESP